MGIVYFLGNNRIVEFLGRYPLPGGLLAALAVVAFFAYEYIRLDPNGRWAGRRTTTRRIAMTLALISVVLIASRFANIWTINNGA